MSVPFTNKSSSMNCMLPTDLVRTRAHECIIIFTKKIMSMPKHRSFCHFCRFGQKFRMELNLNVYECGLFRMNIYDGSNSKYVVCNSIILHVLKKRKKKKNTKTVQKAPRHYTLHTLPQSNRKM